MSTIVLDITVNPTWSPDPIALMMIAEAYDPAAASSVLFAETFDPAIPPGGALVTGVEQITPLASASIAAVDEPATAFLFAAAFGIVEAWRLFRWTSKPGARPTPRP